MVLGIAIGVESTSVMILVTVLSTLELPPLSPSATNDATWDVQPSAVEHRTNRRGFRCAGPPAWTSNPY